MEPNWPLTARYAECFLTFRQLEKNEAVGVDVDNLVIGNRLQLNRKKRGTCPHIFIVTRSLLFWNEVTCGERQIQ